MWISRQPPHNELNLQGRDAVISDRCSGARDESAAAAVTESEPRPRGAKKWLNWTRLMTFRAPMGQRLRELASSDPLMNPNPRRAHRLPPSERARAELIRLLSNGVGRNENVISEFVRVVTRALVQQLLEAEQADFLGGRGRYARRAVSQRGSRNGYEPVRLRTEEGTIKVAVPQVRNLVEPYRSNFMRIVGSDLGNLDRIVLGAYAPWLSKRNNGREFEDVNGAFPISQSAASRLIRGFYLDHQGFIGRDLSDVAVEHVFCDVAFDSSKGRRKGEAMLIAWAIDTVGRKHLLHLAVDDKTSAEAWISLLDDLVRRNMRMPKTVTANGTNGLVEAIARAFPRTVRIRHWFDRPTERKMGIA